MTEAITPLSLQAYSRIASALRNGELAPATKLPIRVLSEQFSVGLMPAREAVQRLAAEQGLALEANRIIRVPSLSPTDFDDLISGTILVEHLVVDGIHAEDNIDAARKFLKNLPLPEFDRITFEKYRRWLANDFQSLFGLTSNKFALRCIETITVRLGPLFYTENSLDQHIERYFCQYHGQLLTNLLDSIARRDRNTTRHLISKKRRFEQYFVCEHLNHNLRSQVSRSLRGD